VIEQGLVTNRILCDEAFDGHAAVWVEGGDDVKDIRVLALTYGALAHVDDIHNSVKNNPIVGRGKWFSIGRRGISINANTRDRNRCYSDLCVARQAGDKACSGFLCCRPSRHSGFSKIRSTLGLGNSPLTLIGALKLFKVDRIRVTGIPCQKKVPRILHKGEDHCFAINILAWVHPIHQLVGVANRGVATTL